MNPANNANPAMDDLTCKQLIERLAEFIDAELDHTDRRAFDHHLAQCQSCVNYLGTYLTTIQLSRAAFQSSQPAQLPPELFAAIESALRATPR